MSHMPMGILNKIEAMRNKFFRGADLDEKMTCINWRKVLAHKKYGGLGVSSLFVLNQALLFKWLWHFLANPQGI